MYWTVEQIDAAVELLAATKPNLCQRVRLIDSVEGRPIHALRLRAGGGTNRRGVLIVGGMHAREMMNPDAIVELAYDLVRAYSSNSELSYGQSAVWSALDVRVMMETLDIWMLPLANPDGRYYVQHALANRMWRMNRRDNPDTSCDGVDVNRNCDFMWRVTGPTTVCDPCSPTQGFVGSLPFSEPESQNIKLMCDSHRIDVFADVHSYSNWVLYPWGHARTQTGNSVPNFTDLNFGLCRALEPPWHQEYMPPQDLHRYQTTATRIIDAIRLVAQTEFIPKTIFQVYNGSTTGTTSDYVYSRHILNPSSRKTYAFAFETGPDLGRGNELASFQPSDPRPIKADAKAGLAELIRQSVCAIEFIGSTVLPRSVQPIRDARDELFALGGYAPEWIELIREVQVELLGIVLSDRSLTKRAAKLMGRVIPLASKRRSAQVALRDIDDGISFLEVLRTRSRSSRTREILKAVVRRLKASEGRTISDGMKGMAKSQPPKGLARA